MKHKKLKKLKKHKLGSIKKRYKAAADYYENLKKKKPALYSHHETSYISQGITLTGKIGELRKHIEKRNGLDLVKRSWVKTYMSKSEVEEFEKRFKWYQIYNKQCKCPDCGFVHPDMKKFIRYAYFWNLETILSHRTVSEITHTKGRRKK